MFRGGGTTGGGSEQNHCKRGKKNYTRDGWKNIENYTRDGWKNIENYTRNECSFQLQADRDMRQELRQNVHKRYNTKLEVHV